jgi:general secretion pathway protein G
METYVKKTIRVIRRHLLALASAGASKRALRGARGATLVEVLIVVAIMALIAGGATLVAFPLYKGSQVTSAKVSCEAVKQAAELYLNLEGSSDQCPTMQDLVTSKKLDAKKTDDPWGTPFKIDCSEGDVRAISAGKDRKFGTPDDVRDDFKDADIKRVKAL